MPPLFFFENQTDRTTSQIDPPLHNVKLGNVTEVKIIDPKHPLFGQAFKVLSITGSSRCSGYAIAEYQEKQILRIPLDVTQLIYSEISSVTKLTFDSINNFIDLTKECHLLCPLSQKKSGKNYQQPKS